MILRRWRKKPTRSLAPYHRLLLARVLFLGVSGLQGATTFAQPWLVIILLGCDGKSFHPVEYTTPPAAAVPCQLRAFCVAHMSYT